jgi:tetratricopeptide (TPR) repeat protein
MLIAQVEPPQEKEGGDYYYRTLAPGLAMAEQDGVYVVNLTNVHRHRWNVFHEADVLVLKNICDADFLPLIRQRKKLRKITVYEMADDLAAIPPWNPVYFFYRNLENLALVFRLAAGCDAVQFSVPRLDSIYGHLNGFRRVFPNQLLLVPPQRSSESHAETVIGWGGSHGHLQDLAQIAPSLCGWIVQQPQAILHLMCSEPIWTLFKGLPGEKKRWTEPGSLEDYLRFLSKIDVGVGPLEDTAFNRCRSDVKFLEYAACGVVPVMARLDPYERSVKDGATGFLYDTPQRMVRILDRLIQDPSARVRIISQAREYVDRERRQTDHVAERLEFYREVMGAVGADAEGGRSKDSFLEWSKTDGAVVKGRHLELSDSHFERLLSVGLVDMQVAKDTDKARQRFEQAARMEANNYLPHLFGASVSLSPLRALTRAIELHPTSLKSWILLGEAFAQQGRTREALQSFASATTVYPDYEIPYLRAGGILNKIGQESQAVLFFEKAKALCRDFEGLTESAKGSNPSLIARGQDFPR